MSKNKKSKNTDFSSGRAVLKLRQALLVWYYKNKRQLPWRQTKNPYHIWLSEIMLQQTTVAVVISYFNNFLEKFPTLEKMAEASIEELLKLWSGLGYYNRIRNFHKAVKFVVDELNGQIPSTKNELIKLSGLGEYTASAVSSIAFNQPDAVVDGNVMRVISRIDAFSQDILTTHAKKYFQLRSNELLDKKNPGDFNQAMMELGATVCLPKNPGCLLCPVRDFCKALKMGKVQDFPVKTKKINYKKEESICLVYQFKDNYFLRKRQDNEIMAGLWEFPVQIKNHQTKIPNGIALKPVKHAIMDKRMTITPFKLKPNRQIKLNQFKDGKWVHIDDLNKMPLTTISKKILSSFITLTRH